MKLFRRKEKKQSTPRLEGGMTLTPVPPETLERWGRDGERAYLMGELQKLLPDCLVELAPKTIIGIDYVFVITPAAGKVMTVGTQRAKVGDVTKLAEKLAKAIREEMRQTGITGSPGAPATMRPEQRDPNRWECAPCGRKETGVAGWGCTRADCPFVLTPSVAALTPKPRLVAACPCGEVISEIIGDGTTILTHGRSPEKLVVDLVAAQMSDVGPAAYKAEKLAEWQAKVHAQATTERTLVSPPPPPPSPKRTPPDDYMGTTP